MVEKQPPPLEACAANVALEAFVVQVRQASVGVQIRALREARIAEIARKRLFTCVSTFMIQHFSPSGKRFPARPAGERFRCTVDHQMHVQVVLRKESFATVTAFEVPRAPVCPLVLYEIVAAVERTAAVAAFERSGTLLVRFHVHRHHVLGREVFSALRAFVRPQTGVSVHVHIVKRLRRVLLVADLAGPYFARPVRVHLPVELQQPRAGKLFATNVTAVFGRLVGRLNHRVLLHVLRVAGVEEKDRIALFAHENLLVMRVLQVLRDRFHIVTLFRLAIRRTERTVVGLFYFNKKRL